jgi:predicted nucleotidyltransferase
MGLKLDLEDLLGRAVDLIETTAVTNPYFIQTSAQTRTLVYAAA